MTSKADLVQVSRKTLARAKRQARGLQQRIEKARPHPGRPTLDEIGISTGTDKSSELHDYLNVYESAVGHLRDDTIQVLEIGIHKAASLRMWETYFPNARIIGVDLDPECRKFANERVTVEVGNQGDQKFVELLAKRYRPTVLIDDGSHRWEHQIASFRTLWPTVKPGGFFIMEDIHTSFGDDYRPVYGVTGTETAYDYLAGIIEGVVAGERAAPPRDEFESYCRATIESAQHLKHSIIFRKRGFAQPWFKKGSVADVSATPWVTETGSYDRIPAEIVGADERVRAGFERLVQQSTVSLGPAASAELTDVTVHRWGPATTGDTILAETLNAAQNLRWTSNLYRPQDDRLWVAADPVAAKPVPPRSDGRRRVLVKQTWDRNYGHWLIDGFGRLAAIRDHLDLTECAYVVNHQPSPQMRRVVLDCFALAGVPENQVEFHSVEPLAFDRLIVPGTIASVPTRKAPVAIRFFEDIAEQVPAGDATRVCLSRDKAARRRLRNEQEVQELLAGQGYAILHPEELTLREQVAALRGATHVVGNMGAALANLVFSPRGVSVLAIASSAMHHDYFYDIACLKEGRYRGLQGPAITDGAGATLVHDFEVDLGQLKTQLDWLHGTA